jgi:hypothetical protein
MERASARRRLLDRSKKQEPEEIKPPWPRPGQILIEGRAGWNSASVLPGQDRSWVGYAKAYRAAAEALFAHCDRGEADPESMVYPVAFLWRHHLELMMKILIAAARSLRDDASGFPNDHRLKQLWAQLRPDPVRQRVLGS